MRNFHVVRGVSITMLCLAVAACTTMPQPVAPPPPPDPIEPAAGKEFADGVYQMLAEPMTWSIGESGVTIVVPDGFVHDNASIPSEFRMFLDTHGPYGKAAIVHDYLYWAQPCTQRQADNLLMVAMKESGVSWWKRTAIHRAVRAAGKRAFDANRAEREAGGVRVVPSEYRKLPAMANWHEYEAMLRESGVHDPEFPASADYCHFGDSVRVPTGPDDDAAG
jgi:hypothetical protein